MEFKNKLFEKIYYSRFIASWIKAGGNFNKSKKVYVNEDHYYRTSMFEEWLRQITINGKHIPEETIKEIYELATSGKLELQEDAKKFLYG